MKVINYINQIKDMRETFKRFKAEDKECFRPYYIGRVEGMSYMTFEDDELSGDDYLEVMAYADEAKKEIWEG